MNNMVNGMNEFICGFEFQNITHTDMCQEIEGIWPNNLVQQ